MIKFTNRILKIFIRDKLTVFLSILADIIVILLYFLFVRDNLYTRLSEIENIYYLLDLWMIGGVIGISSVTSSLGIFSIMVSDKNKNITMDFATLPVPQYSLMLGYLLSAVILTTAITLFLLFISEIYLLCLYGIGLDFLIIIYTIILSLFISFSNCSVMLLLISFFNSVNALAAAAAIIGALMGFLTAVYMPIGMFSSFTASIIRIIPASHGVMLIRYLIIQPTMDAIEFTNTPKEFFIEFMGLRFSNNNAKLPIYSSYIFIFTSGFIALNFTLLKPYINTIKIHKDTSIHQINAY